ncbi:MAG TPA: HupE/UreJ family protein [Burkholderiaceae bacterium]
MRFNARPRSVRANPAPPRPNALLAIDVALDAPARSVIDHTQRRPAYKLETVGGCGGPGHIVRGSGRGTTAQRSLRALLITVTAFTLAHSLSLAAATLGWLHASPAWVEPAIALSIAWVALENVFGQASTWRRFALTVAFGLVHGLAFAEALIELNLAGWPLARALLGFNLGVELAQAVVVVAAAPLLAWLALRPRGAQVERALSLAIAVMGAIWLVQRLAGV